MLNFSLKLLIFLVALSCVIESAELKKADDEVENVNEMKITKSADGKRVDMKIKEVGDLKSSEKKTKEAFLTKLKKTLAKNKNLKKIEMEIRANDDEIMSEPDMEDETYFGGKSVCGSAKEVRIGVKKALKFDNGLKAKIMKKLRLLIDLEEEKQNLVEYFKRQRDKLKKQNSIVNNIYLQFSGKATESSKDIRSIVSSSGTDTRIDIDSLLKLSNHEIENILNNVLNISSCPIGYSYNGNGEKQECTPIVNKIHGIDQTITGTSSIVVTAEEAENAERKHNIEELKSYGLSEGNDFTIDEKQLKIKECGLDKIKKSNFKLYYKIMTDKRVPGFFKFGPYPIRSVITNDTMSEEEREQREGLSHRISLLESYGLKEGLNFNIDEDGLKIFENGLDILKKGNEELYSHIITEGQVINQAPSNVPKKVPMTIPSMIMNPMQNIAPMQVPSMIPMVIPGMAPLPNVPIILSPMVMTEGEISPYSHVSNLLKQIINEGGLENINPDLCSVIKSVDYNLIKNYLERLDENSLPENAIVNASKKKIHAILERILNLLMDTPIKNFTWKQTNHTEEEENEIFQAIADHSFNYIHEGKFKHSDLKHLLSEVDSEMLIEYKEKLNANNLSKEVKLEGSIEENAAVIESIIRERAKEYDILSNILVLISLSSKDVETAIQENKSVLNEISIDTVKKFREELINNKLLPQVKIMGSVDANVYILDKIYEALEEEEYQVQFAKVQNILNKTQKKSVKKSQVATTQDLRNAGEAAKQLKVSKIKKTFTIEPERLNNIKKTSKKEIKAGKDSLAQLIAKNAVSGKVNVQFPKPQEIDKSIEKVVANLKKEIKSPAPGIGTQAFGQHRYEMNMNGNENKIAKYSVENTESDSKNVHIPLYTHVGNQEISETDSYSEPDADAEWEPDYEEDNKDSLNQSSENLKKLIRQQEKLLETKMELEALKKEQSKNQAVLKGKSKFEAAAKNGKKLEENIDNDLLRVHEMYMNQLKRGKNKIKTEYGSSEEVADNWNDRESEAENEHEESSDTESMSISGLNGKLSQQISSSQKEATASDAKVKAELESGMSASKYSEIIAKLVKMANEGKTKELESIVSTSPELLNALSSYKAENSEKVESSEEITSSSISSKNTSQNGKFSMEIGADGMKINSPSISNLEAEKVQPEMKMTFGKSGKDFAPKLEMSFGKGKTMRISDGEMVIDDETEKLDNVNAHQNADENTTINSTISEKTTENISQMTTQNFPKITATTTTISSTTAAPAPSPITTADFLKPVKIAANEAAEVLHDFDASFVAAPISKKEDVNVIAKMKAAPVELKSVAGLPNMFGR